MRIDMKTLPLLAAVSAIALMAAPAFAQTDPAAMTVAQTTTTMTPDTSAPAPDAATMAPPAAATPAVADSTNVQVVSNGPIPDTPQERAKYKPLSHAGRHTAPVGN
jgi:hypothetical protein